VDFDHIADSGERTDFSTGSRRDMRLGKGRYDFISPIALRRLAKHCEGGADKYGARNWEKGMPLHTYLDSALRHINTYLEHRVLGQKMEEDHLTAALWNLMCLIHTEEMIAVGKLPPKLDDLPGGYHPRSLGIWCKLRKLLSWIISGK